MDGLTGLPTHKEVARYLKVGAMPFAAIFDIDALAWLTSWYGYQGSDEAIVTVGKAIQEAASIASGSTFRIGGDEFLVVLPEACQHDRALAFAHDVIRTVTQLEIPYCRVDDPSRRRLTVNAVVCRVGAGLTSNAHAARAWIHEAIWRAKEGDVHRVEVVADAGDALPPWGLP